MDDFLIQILVDRVNSLVSHRLKFKNSANSSFEARNPYSELIGLNKNKTVIIQKLWLRGAVTDC